MDKRGIIIVVICFAVVLGWQALVTHYWPAPLPGTEPAAKGGAHTNVVARTAKPLEMKTAPPSAPEIAPPPPAAPAAPKAPEKTVTLENKLLRAELTTYGGGIRDVVLKTWKVGGTNDSPVMLNRFASEPVFALTGGSAKDTNGTVSVLAWPGADSNAVFALTESAPDRVVFTGDAAGGLRIVKEFTLGSNYVLSCRVRIENLNKQPVETPAFGVAVGTSAQLDEQDDPTYVNADHWEGALSTTGRAKAIYTLASSMSQDVFTTAGVKWAAVKNRYFALVMTPKEPAGGFHARKVELPRSLTPAASAAPLGAHGWLLMGAAKVDAGAAVTREFQLYAGPKEYNRLAALGNKQEEVMEFGWFGRIAEALLWSLTALYKIIPNYGIAIIIITIIIKLLFWPIQAMSTRSMKKMQELQPLIAKLKEKFPDDPQKQQQEMMKLYKEHKVNPMGGCLPLLAQIPVFIALYNMLRTVIELRGAKFLWIHDLSLPDTIFTLAGIPVNPLPLLMCATTIWQQKLTPTANVDPTQQKMMMLMPLMFVFMFYSMSSGLVLYWTVQNLLSILQQWMALRDTKKPGATPAPTRR